MAAKEIKQIQAWEDGRGCIHRSENSAKVANARFALEAYIVNSGLLPFTDSSVETDKALLQWFTRYGAGTMKLLNEFVDAGGVIQHL